MRIPCNVLLATYYRMYHRYCLELLLQSFVWKMDGQCVSRPCTKR